MITEKPEPKEEPFTFVRPQMPARPAATGAELEANRATLLPAAQAYTATEEILQRVTAEAERLGKDRNLTAQGRRAAFTAFALDAIPKLREHSGKLDAAGAAVQAEAEQVQQAAMPAPTEAQLRERSNIAAAFGRLNHNQQKVQYGRALSGQDAELLASLVEAHPVVTGLDDTARGFLRSEYESAHIDPAAAERCRDKAAKVGSVTRALTAAIEALENASDREQLKAAKVATLRKSDFADTKAKSDWIDQHGLDAFKRLPA